MEEGEHHHPKLGLSSIWSCTKHKGNHSMQIPSFVLCPPFTLPVLLSLLMLSFRSEVIVRSLGLSALCSDLNPLPAAPPSPASTLPAPAPPSPSSSSSPFLLCLHLLFGPSPFYRTALISDRSSSLHALLVLLPFGSSLFPCLWSALTSRAASGAFLACEVLSIQRPSCWTDHSLNSTSQA